MLQQLVSPSTALEGWGCASPDIAKYRADFSRHSRGGVAPSKRRLAITTSPYTHCTRVSLLYRIATSTLPADPSSLQHWITSIAWRAVGQVQRMPGTPRRQAHLRGCKLSPVSSLPSLLWPYYCAAPLVVHGESSRTPAATSSLPGAAFPSKHLSRSLYMNWSKESNDSTHTCIGWHRHKRRHTGHSPCPLPSHSCILTLSHTNMLQGQPHTQPQCDTATQ